jgi:cytochrome c oxidase assembly factor CtaG
MKRGPGLAILVGALTAAFPALAHDTGAPHPEPGWTFAPWLVALLAASLAAYGLGWARLLARSSGGRDRLVRSGLLFIAGWLALVVAEVSPLHEAGERSFALHMIEHELIMLVATPLLVLARPLGVMIWSLPQGGRRALGSLGRRAVVRGPFNLLSAAIPATLMQAAALWLWHAPGLFDLALGGEGWHIAQHLSFLIPSLFFWQAMLANPRVPPGLAVICLFATSVVAGALGALMAFSASPWYARYAELGLAPFGLSPTEDQQLAGLLMWIPGGLVHVTAALALMSRMVMKTEPCHPTDLKLN